MTRKLGLALGGGGARGLAHLGVLQVLEEAGISVQAISGTSMGGFIGALYAAGIPLKRIEELALSVGPPQLWRHLFDLTVSPHGFFRGQQIERAFARALGNEHTRFSQLNIPFAVVAADLRSGREMVIKQGSLVRALRATCSVPGVFIPVEYDQASLVDGGILNNVPVDVARDLGAEVVLAVDVLPDFSQNQVGQSPVVRGLRQEGIPAAIREQVHVQMIMLSAITAQRLKADPPDLLLQPEISERVGLFMGYEMAKETILAGRRVAEARIDELRGLVANLD